MPAKRVSDCKNDAVQKKQKLSDEIVGVLDAIAAAEHLTRDVQEILSAGCPGSLGEFADKRHAYQDMVVTMIGDFVINASKQNLELKVSTVEAGIPQTELTKIEVGDSFKQAEQSLQDKVQAMETAEKELSTLSDIMMSAASALEEATVSETEGGKELVRLTSAKADLRDALDTHLASVLSGSTEPVHVDPLMSVLSELKLEETLRVCLPKVFAKPVSERGAFDDLVLKELEQILQAHIAKLQVAISEEQPGATSRAAAVAAARRKAEDVTTAHEHKVRELEAAREAHEQQLTRHGDAMQAEFDVELQLAKEVKERDAAKCELETFVNFPCEYFSLLEARVSKQYLPEPEPTVDTVVTHNFQQFEASVQPFEMPQI